MQASDIAMDFQNNRIPILLCHLFGSGVRRGIMGRCIEESLQ